MGLNLIEKCLVMDVDLSIFLIIYFLLWFLGLPASFIFFNTNILIDLKNLQDVYDKNLYEIICKFCIHCENIWNTQLHSLPNFHPFLFCIFSKITLANLSIFELQSVSSLKKRFFIQRFFEEITGLGCNPI
jgi:hypothetical protein